MKRFLYLSSLFAGMILASCSSEIPVNDPGEQNASNVIVFRVSAPATTRAAHSYCNQNMPESFKVWGRIGRNTPSGILWDSFITGETVIKGADGTYSFEKPQYWPQEEYDKICFTAITDDENGYDIHANNFSCTVKSEVAEQLDPMMAQTVMDERPANNTINLTFNHLLSQIVFSAKCKEDIKVDVRSISVEGKLRDSGSARFGDWENKDDGYFEHDENHGEWKDLFSWYSPELKDVNYKIDFATPKTVEYNVENKSTVFTGSPVDNH